MTIASTGLLSWMVTQDDVGDHPVTIRVDDGQGLFTTQSFTINVTWESPAPGIEITSAPLGTARVGVEYDYDPTAAEDLDGLTVGVSAIWSLDSAPAGMSINPRTATVSWTPTQDQLGSATVVLRATSMDGGGSVTQTFTITVVPGDIPPNIVSTPSTQGTVGQLYTYAVKATDQQGNPLTYSLVTAPAGMAIDPSTGLVLWAPTAGQIGSQSVVINVSDGQGGSAVQGYSIVVSSLAGTLPPTITSTPALLAPVSQPYSYQVLAADPQGESLSYSFFNAPVGMTIDPKSGLVQWTLGTSQLGSNSVLLAVTNTSGEVATQNFAITVQPPNQPPAINSTPVTTATAGAAYEYDVNATDPDGDSLTYSLTTAPAGMTIDSLGRITWSPQPANIGNQPVAVSVSDGRGSTVSQSFTIAVVADAVPPQVILSLSANPVDINTPDIAVISATDNVGVTALTLRLNGTPVSIDSQGRATLPDATAGVFTLVATASDAAGNVGTATQTLTVINPQVTNAPVVAITTPADNGMVTAPTQVIGTVQDPNLVSYTLSVAPIGSQNFTTISTGTSQVNNGVLGTFDSTLLQDGSYDLRLIATNTGGLSSEADVTVDVSGILKLGNFTVSFTDLTVPVSGIPITVTRTYDSLTANQSRGFGYGWRLEFRDTQLQTSVLSTGYEADDLFNPFQFGSHVYITLPGSPREGFTFEPTPAPGLLGGFLGIYEPAFVPDPGVKDTLTVPSANLSIASDGSLEGFATALPYNPASPIFGNLYTLTTSQGLVYSINASTGEINSVTNSNNDTLTFSDAGVTSSSGARITFQRDAQGRIAAIIDPAGEKILYQYDANSNLVGVTDRSNNTTQFVYLSTPAHYLSKVIDPLGRTGIRTDYDANGRLDEIIDANGNPVKLNYAPGASTETVTDALGNPTTYEYDDRGNVIEEIDALGGITLRTFDANNDMLTETDPMGRTTVYTYDSRGDVLSKTDPMGNATFSNFKTITFGPSAAPISVLEASTDPLGNTTSFAVNAAGDYTARTDALGNTTTGTIDPSGNPASVTEPDGSTTTFVYDANGNVLSETDALGNTTSYTYDANGNPLTSTTTMTAADGSLLTLTTTTQYDADGRVIAVTDPDGNVSQTKYDADGNKIETIDPLGRVTKYIYDDTNRLIETIYPDGSTTQTEYDADGHQTATIDQLGRMTQYQYDALGRLVKTIYPDGSSAETKYDADGEVIATTDQLGNTTTYQYDADGHQISQTDPLGNSITTTYDTDGRAVAQTDALGNTTKSIYNADGKLVETDYADGTKTATTYDAEGRVLSKTDQLGRTTRYEYDADGRQTAVIDPLGQRTQYAYDEEGDLIRKTDANGNVTTYESDGEGRQIAILLPALPGQAPFGSTTKYDADGNVVSTTDYNGNTIQFAYDALNRLISEEHPDGSSVVYTYTLTGKVATVTDSRGKTAYTYDQRDRLLSCTEPDGTTISYAYNAAGDCTAVTTPAGTTSYTFDALGQELTVTDPNGGVTASTYDAAGRLVRTVFSNGIVETRSYDDLNRLTFHQDVSSSTVIASYTYTLGPTGLIDEVVENTGRTIDYTYDALDRLTQEKITAPVSGNRTIDYTYDPVGNRLSMADSVAGTTLYTYDAMDRLTSSTLAGQVTNYTYDRNGNLLTEVSPTETLFYQNDVDNRLIATGSNGVISETNKYDSAGNLVSQTVGGQETRFLINTVGPLSQAVMEYSPSGGISAAYVYGNGLISQVRNAVLSIYLIDGQQNTRELTNAAGKVTDQYTYDAFGRVLFQSGTTVNRYLFAGQQSDPISGLTYMRARFYSSALGRFTSADPLRQVPADASSFQFYVYTHDDPVNRIDPSGLDDFDLTSLSVALSIAGSLAGAVYGASNYGFWGGIAGAFLGAALGLGVAYLIGGGIVVAAPSAGAAGNSAFNASYQALVDSLAGGEGARVTAETTQAIGKASEKFLLRNGLKSIVPFPAFVAIFKSADSGPLGPAVIEVFRKTIQDSINESVGDPLSTQYYKTLLASLPPPPPGQSPGDSGLQ